MSARNELRQAFEGAFAGYSLQRALDGTYARPALRADHIHPYRGRSQFLQPFCQRCLEKRPIIGAAQRRFWPGGGTPPPDAQHPAKSGVNPQGMAGFHRARSPLYFRNPPASAGTNKHRLYKKFRPIGSRDEALTSACGRYYVRAEINRKEAISP